MNTNELRQIFLNYFAQNQHTIVSSSSLIPANDPTLLFTNAGMVQFKEIFLGRESRHYVRATSSQRCVRAGGKHNDLENVGYTARHHTFFEMLGNFSFGDYFKRKAIQLAWAFLTEVLKLPAHRLWVTVFHEDQEAADIWLKEVKVDPERFSRCGEKDNFWSMGDTGPCGPCTEIFYDHGPEIPGGPPGSPDQEGDRYIEIWNLVFMQYNRTADGQMSLLPKPSVDTGMGLERIAAIMQGVHSNYEIDLFRHLIKATAEVTGITDLNQISLRVIADHIRAAAFLITDGVTPSNEGRGYVLRRIIRRAVRHAHKLGCAKPFFYALVAPLAKEMGEAYPELSKAQSTVEKVLKHEEHQFADTLDQGMKLLERHLQDLNAHIIPGNLLFRLYDTYGFPPDLTADIARERGYTLDYDGFEQEMEKQRKQSQAAGQFTAKESFQTHLFGETEFIGYEHLSGEALVTLLLSENQPIDSLVAGQKGAVILNRTPFYAESGGQVGDKGQLFFENGVFTVQDTQKQGLAYLHYGQLMSGVLCTGMSVSAEVAAIRHAIMLNHSATHLLHAALRRLLGEHVVQKGSLVEAERLRFDFSHFSSLSQEELSQIERLVNDQIRANLPCHTDYMRIDDAKRAGALALFEEKYADEVRVLSMGEFSTELCGGTHVSRTGEIGLFKILTETGVAAGIRRIEAITGSRALQWAEELQIETNHLAALLKVSPSDILTRVRQLIAQNKDQEKLLTQLRQAALQHQLDALIPQAERINDMLMIVTKIRDVDLGSLRQAVDRLKQKLSQAVILLATVSENKVYLVAGVTKNCTALIKANNLVAFTAEQLGGKGGGRPDMAQGGGDKVEALDNVLDSARFWIKEKLL